MATNKVYTVKYRRKREGKTDYKKRMKLLLGKKARLVIRTSLRHISLQIIEFQPTGDKVTATVHSRELAQHGWKGHSGSTSAAYLTGLLLAKKAGKVGAILDIGQYTSVKGSKLYAAVKGANDGGAQNPIAKEVIPANGRIRGEHVASYAKALKADKARYEKQFSNYLKTGLDPEKLPEHFDTVKKSIGGQ